MQHLHKNWRQEKSDDTDGTEYSSDVTNKLPSIRFDRRM